jgi:hypothetical protein
MRRTVLFLGCCGALFANTASNLRIEATAQEVKLTYTVADSSANCKVEVSTDPAFGNSAVDVNGTLFPGYDQDLTRPRTQVYGNARTVVVGQRTVLTGSDGFSYSGSLQNATAYYVRICGNLTGTFRTKIAPFGHTYPVPLPNAWPYAHNGQFVDPLTGVGILPISKEGMYGDNAGSKIANITVVAGGPFDDSGQANPWTINGNVWTYAADGTHSSSALYIPLDLSGFPGGNFPGSGPSIDGRGIDYIQITPLTATATGSGDDSKAAFALTVNGVTALANSAQTPTALWGCSTSCTVATTTPILRWWFTGNPTLSIQDFTKKSLAATYQNSTGALTWNSGNYFPPNMVAGSRVWINGTSYRITAYVSPKQVTLDPGLNPGGNCSSTCGVAVTVQNFGILAQKLTNTNGTQIQITQFKVTIGYSYGFNGFFNNSDAEFCQKIPTYYNGTPDGCASFPPARITLGYWPGSGGTTPLTRWGGLQWLERPASWAAPILCWRPIRLLRIRRIPGCFTASSGTRPAASTPP